MSPQDAAWPQWLDEIEDDLRLLARTITDDGARHGLDEVATEFGVDPADLDED